MVQIVLEVSDDKMKELQELVTKFRLTSLKDLVNLSLTLLQRISQKEGEAVEIHFVAIEKDSGPGHTFTLDQEKKFADWMVEHDKTCPIRSEQDTIGGRFTSHFTPTGVGTVEKVRCACGAEVDLTDYDSW